MHVAFLLYNTKNDVFFDLNPDLISYEIRTTRTSAYQSVKLGPLSWEMNDSFVEKILSMYNIHQHYHVP